MQGDGDARPTGLGHVAAAAVAAGVVSVSAPASAWASTPARRLPNRPDLQPAAALTASLRPLPEQVAKRERRAMAETMQASGGNRLAASSLLKISRAAFYDKLARYPELAVALVEPAAP